MVSDRAISELSFANHSDLIEVLTTQPKLMDDLKHALGGRYDLVLQMLSVLENGPAVKAMTDHVVNLCRHSQQISSAMDTV